MLLVKTCFVLNLCFVLALGRWTDVDHQKIDTEFYYNNLKFHSKGILNCDLDLYRLYCRFKCKKHYGICLEGNCYCIFEDDSAETPRIQAETNRVSTEESSEETYDGGLKYALPPALRHHIAHFCPDLEEARKCIRKCAKEGKPAFCGKDHVCYCGHKYNNKHKNQKVDAKAVYSQFQDLYLKYFGITPAPIKATSANDTEKEEMSKIVKTGENN